MVPGFVFVKGQVTRTLVFLLLPMKSIAKICFFLQMMLAWFLLSTSMYPQRIVCELPLQGIEGVDYFIVNYVDHDHTEGLRDYHCGVQTYDGHQGTDFVIRSFSHMDAGVNVLACADGVVYDLHDGEYDRNKSNTPRALGFGNYVTLMHHDSLGDPYYSTYAHLRRGSIIVEAGDTVQVGDTLGQVGSSGFSSHPHLHFELWRHPLVTGQPRILIDPFGGPCSGESFWRLQPDYHDDYRFIDGGTTTWWPITLDTLRERPPTPTFVSSKDSAVTYWCLQQGVNRGDSLRVVWLQPNDSVWFAYTHVVGDNSRYFYFWSWIHIPPYPGVWKVVYSVNQISVDIDEFNVVSTGVDTAAVSQHAVHVEIAEGRIRVVDDTQAGVVIHVYTLDGRLVLTCPTADCTLTHPGIYVILVGNSQASSRFVYNYHY